MEFFRQLLFEDPLRIYLVLAAAELALAAWWHARRTRALTAALLAPVLLAGAVAATARWVVTDREKIAAAVKAIATAVEIRDLTAVAPYLDPQVAGVTQGSPIGREELLAAAREALRRYPVLDIRLMEVETSISGHSAETRFKAHVRLRDFGVISTAWRLRWVKTPDERWLIDQVEGLSPPGLKNLSP